ncbi:MAG: pseudouridine synthase [Oceanococcus sp.]
MCQFSPSGEKRTLADYIQTPNIYPAGRLDYDSEGLLILTDDGRLQHRISTPGFKLEKTYWVQVEGAMTQAAINALAAGVKLKDGITAPALASSMDAPNLWERDPPIRERREIPTSWLRLCIKEGRNRQVRRMTAAVGFPTLRLIRAAIGPISLDQLQPGESCGIDVQQHFAALLAAKPEPAPRGSQPRRQHPHKPNRQGRSSRPRS